MRRRQEEIRSKGFAMVENPEDDKGFDEPRDFSKIKVGLRTLEDAVLDVGTYKRINRNFGDKNFVLNCINRHDYTTLRDVSEYFYESSGIYSRLCQYLAFLYRYDWYVTPYIVEKNSNNKVLKDFSKVLEYLDKSEVKKTLGNMALEVMKKGAYYGYIVDVNDHFMVQQLPANYCRSRMTVGNSPVVELNMRYFDAAFPIVQQRLQIIKMFPKEIQKAYILYKEGKLVGDYPGDTNGWFVLDPELSIKFNLNKSDCPPMTGAIPSIIDLDLAQELDRKKTMQQLLKVFIQKLPLDKNGDLIFDMDEAKDIHNNAVGMMKHAVGVDVLTTFADVDVANMQDKNSTTTTDDLMKVERTVYNNLGVSQNLFNTDGNMALDRSIQNDEASVRDLLYQFQSMLNRIVNKKFDRAGHYSFKVSILETTIYNYKELSKMYKEQTQIGYSKMLPQVALGHSQSSILATAQFENDILHLSDIMIPPMMSSTMSGRPGEKTPSPANKNAEKENGTKKVNPLEEKKEAGRPEKEDSQKSDKTIRNKEAMS